MDLTEFSRRGGHARAKSMTAEERRKSALKASQAAAKARRAKAKHPQKAKRRPA